MWAATKNHGNRSPWFSQNCARDTVRTEHDPTCSPTTRAWSKKQCTVLLSPNEQPSHSVEICPVRLHIRCGSHESLLGSRPLAKTWKQGSMVLAVISRLQEADTASLLPEQHLDILDVWLAVAAFRGVVPHAPIILPMQKNSAGRVNAPLCIARWWRSSYLSLVSAPWQKRYCIVGAYAAHCSPNAGQTSARALNRSQSCARLLTRGFGSSKDF
jgi:hypothetical protein